MTTTSKTLQLSKEEVPIQNVNKFKPAYGDSYVEHLPELARKRFEKYGIDLTQGYPERPSDIPLYLDESIQIRAQEYPYIERGQGVKDIQNSSLFKAAKEVINLTKHIGTEIVGLQLSELTDQQKDELAYLISARTVVFFRDQDLSPQKQLELGHYWGQVEVHPMVGHVPNLPGATVIWPDWRKKTARPTYKQYSNWGNAHWHADLDHEFQPAAITHLHLDTIPDVGGDTVWASGYAAYDKLSPAFQKFLDGKHAIHHSANVYIDREDPLSGPKRIERAHPLVRTNPATGWKSLFFNPAHTTRIVELEPGESDIVIKYLADVFEKNLDIQVRFNWKPTVPGLGVSAIWDNRTAQHFAVYDYEGDEPRHGTRVTSLGEVPYLDPNSKSQREALGLSL